PDLTAEADAVLTIEHGPTILDDDGEGDHEHQRQREKRKRRRSKEIEKAGRAAASRLSGKTLREDQPCRIDEVDLDPSRLALEERQEIDHGDAAEPAIEQILDGKVRSPLVHRDDDLVDAVRWRVRKQPARRVHDAPVIDLPALPGRGHKVGDADSALIRSPPQPEKARGTLPGTVYEDLAAERLVIDERPEKDASDSEQAEA